MMEKSQPTTEGLRMMKLLLIAVVLGLATDASHGLETKSLHPILLVPGLHASRLEAKLDKPKVVKSICSKKSDWFTIWFNPLQLSPFSVDCWIDNFGMDFDEASGKPVNRAGVQIRAPDFGGTSSVENLNPIKGIIGYMDKLVTALVKLGYKRGETVRAAPNDFRLSPDDNPEYQTNLKNLTETMFAAAGNKRVILLSHSTGSRNLYYFLTQQTPEWKEKHIERWISSAGSFGGDVVTLATLSAGVEDLSLLFKSRVNAAGLSKENTRKLFRSYSSTAFLSPDPLAFGDKVIFQFKDRNFTAADLSDVFQTIGHETGIKVLQRTKTLIKNLDAPGVKVSCFYGSKVPTIGKIVYENEKSLLNGAKLVQGDGDGNINRISSSVCEKWSSSEGFESKEFVGINHLNLIRDSKVLKQIIDTVSRVNGQEV